MFSYESYRVEVPGFPLLTKMAYIHADGKEREWASTHSKTAKMSTNVGMRQLNDTIKGVASFLQAMPSSSGSQGGGRNGGSIGVGLQAGFVGCCVVASRVCGALFMFF